MLFFLYTLTVYQAALASDRCWGYEDDCGVEQRLSQPQCPDPSRGWSVPVIPLSHIHSLNAPT